VLQASGIGRYRFMELKYACSDGVLRFRTWPLKIIQEYTIQRFLAHWVRHNLMYVESNVHFGLADSQKLVNF